VKTRHTSFGLVGAGLGLLVMAAPSCSAPAKGALVLAVSTDMQVPKDMNVVSIFVSTSGVSKFDFLGRIQPDGTVSLPSTLAIVEPDDANAEVRIRVIGFQNLAGVENARVLRDVVTTVPHESTVLMRVPLSFLDDGSVTGTLPAKYVPSASGGVPDGTTAYDPTGASIHPTCPLSAGKTMIGGECADVRVDSSKLPPYDGSSVFGDAGLKSDGMPGSCFDVARCFATAAPVTGLDTSHCTFTLPPGVDGAKTNLALETPATGACVGDKCFVPLENDPSDGWSAQGSTVHMLPGVCKKIGDGAMLYQAPAGACAPKGQASPVCQLEEGSDGGTPVDAGADAPAPMDAGAEADAGCTPKQTRCSATAANTPEVCDPSGVWQPGSACSNQACVAGACTGTCAPGTMKCADTTTPSLCDASGTAVPQTACAGATPYCYLGACVATFPSCQGGGKGADTACGAAGSSDCCGSLDVAAGNFDRDNSSFYPATIDAFRLDAYEVTVGRFRKFVNATAPLTGPAWAPAAASGKHTFLPGGGLVDGVVPEGGASDAGSFDATVEGGADGGAAPPVFESGWDPAWESLPGTQQAWANALVCDLQYATWTLSVGAAGDALPINCVTWAEAAAFCIWDGGFLPSEAEWAYVATGGTMQQQLPWASTVTLGSNAQLADYGCYYGATPGTCTGVQNIAPVGSIPAGNSALWGQSDLAGNVSEWLLDWYASPYTIAPCTNCANTAPATSARSIRGGAFYDSVNALYNTTRNSLAPGDRGANLGFRCARAPSGVQ
jgi:sulfatase modifying factor 1